jgi:hypothetical protein
MICLILFVGCCYKHVPYLPNTENITNPKVTIKRVLQSQPSDVLPVHVEVTDEYIQTFHLQERINKTAIAIAMVLNSAAVNPTTTRGVTTTVYYSNISEINIFRKNNSYRIGICDSGGRLLLSAHTYIKNEAMAFVDAVATLRHITNLNFPNESASNIPNVIETNENKFERPKDASFLLKSNINNTGYWINTDKWSFWKAKDNPDAEYEFQLKGKSLYGLTITEEIAIPIETLADIAFANARSVAPNMKIGKKEYRIVNGNKLLYMEMTGTIQGINYTYIEYYYSNSSGSTQLSTYTGSNLVAKYKSEIYDFLNGLVTQTERASNISNVIETNENKFERPKDSSFLLKSNTNNTAYWINTNKWAFGKAKDNPDAEYDFELKGKALYGMTITEEIEIPFETLADTAFANVRSVAPNMKIVKQEYRIVNGNKVLYMKMNGTIQGVNGTCIGYYYTNSSGSTQLLTFTDSNLVAKYKSEIYDFLNGLVTQ